MFMGSYDLGKHKMPNDQSPPAKKSVKQILSSEQL